MFSRSVQNGFFLAGVLLVFAAVSPPVEAAELHIGFIDSERIFAEYQATKEAQAEFNADVEKWTRDLEERKRELDALMEEYESQSLILSEPRRREREEELQQKRSELEAFQREIWGPNGKIAQRNEQLTRPIIEKMNEVLQRIGRDEGFSVIFDAADGNVVFVDRALDLTDRVLEELHATK